MARYKFDQIAFNSTDKKKPVDEDKEHYIGLEHLDSGSLKVTRWGSEIAPKGEKLLMKKGDVLFGKRRAYQKKVAIAPFDGIFSAHGLVLRPKTDVIDPGFFPLFIASDYFLDAAIKISVGSLSPTINWRDLKELEFDLPSISVQQKLAKVLWAINDTKEAYQKLIQETDELVKSQFIEMFGDLINGPKYPGVRFGALGEMVTGGTPSSKHEEYFGGDIPFVSTPCLGNNYISAKDAQNYLTEAGVKNSTTHRIPPYSLMVGNRVGVGKSSINTCEMCTNQDILSFINIDTTKYDLLFLKKVIEQYAPYYDEQKRGATIKGVPSDVIKNSMVPDVSLEMQKSYTHLVDQSDKSKFELNEAIKDLDAMYKRIIKDNLG